MAEKAEMSLQYLALLEMGRKFPSSEMLEKLATALDIETYELLAVAPSATNELEQLHQTIVTDMKQIVKEAIKETINEELEIDSERKMACCRKAHGICYLFFCSCPGISLVHGPKIG